MKTIKMAKRLGAQIVQFSILTPYPGTRLYERLKSKINTNNLSLFDGTNLVFEHPTFFNKRTEKTIFESLLFRLHNPKIGLHAWHTILDKAFDK